jgi:hypothetical protein
MNNEFEGQWNGETAKCRVVSVIIGKEPENMKDFIERTRPDLKRYLWFVPFIGETRQAVEVKQGDAIFYIDNSDGSGIEKVMNGGMWRSFHRSIYPEHVLTSIPQDRWIKHTGALAHKIQLDIDAAWMQRDREGYEAHKAWEKKMFETLAAARKEQESILRGSDGPRNT